MPAFLLLAACASGPVTTTRVLVPAAVSCVPGNLPTTPYYPDNDATLVNAADAAERYRLLILGREVRIARLGMLEGVVEACAGDPEK